MLVHIYLKMFNNIEEEVIRQRHLTEIKEERERQKTSYFMKKGPDTSLFSV